MYVPEIYRAADGDQAFDLINANPMAVLVSGDALDATHLPVIVQRVEQAGVGSLLLGHMNRANPQWAALSPASEVLIVFTGPHGYISPADYPHSPAAPTWNFAAVHVRGLLTPIDDPDQTRAVVRATARRLERRFGKGWDMSASLEYFDRLLPGVGAFRVTVTHMQSMFKMSQEQPIDTRLSVIDALSGSGNTADLARLMSSTLERDRALGQHG